MRQFLKIFVLTTLALLGFELMLGALQWAWLVVAGAIEWHGNMKIVLAEIEASRHVILLNFARAPQESIWFAVFAGLLGAFVSGDLD